MSKYTDFVKANIRSAPGKNQKEKFQNVAKKWRMMKGKGKGLTAPGMHSGRGIKLRRKRKGGNADARPAGYGAPDTRDWSDWGDKPSMDGEGVWDTIKDVGKKVLKKGVDLALEKGGPALAKWAGSKSPAAQKLIELALEHGGKKLADLAKEKISGLGIHKTRKWLHEHMLAHPKKMKGKRSGGAISGLVSKRQQTALNEYIRRGGSMGEC